MDGAPFSMVDKPLKMKGDENDVFRRPPADEARDGFVSNLKGCPLTLSGHDIVCLASASWDAMWVNAQHLMHRLAPENRILYVNNLGLRPPGASRGDLAKIKKRVGEWFGGTIAVEQNLWTVSPVGLPLHGAKSVRAFNEWNLARSLRRHAGALGFGTPILWTFLPLGAGVIGKLDESLVVYHCVDDYAANPGVPEREIRAMEDRLLEKADLMIATNPVLYAERKHKTKNAVYLGNVADVAHFLPRAGRRVPAALAKLPRPIIGYHGNISGYKTDLKLIGEVAKAFPTGSVVLVGPVGWGDPHTDVAELQRLGNVHFIGRVAYDVLPEYVAAFDVAILPLNDNESTQRSFPMKFYEYMASGKAIVARDLPAFADYRERPELCRLASDAPTFVSAIREARDGAEDIVAARIAAAKRHSWEVRTAQIGDLVTQALAAKGKAKT